MNGSFNGTVTVALYSNPTHTSLGGKLTVTAKRGVATFPDLTIDAKSAMATQWSSPASAFADAHKLHRRDTRLGHATGHNQSTIRSPPRHRVRAGCRGRGPIRQRRYRLRRQRRGRHLEQPGRRHPRWILERNDPERRGHILWLDAEWSWRRIHAPSLHQPPYGATSTPFNVTVVATAFTVNSLGDTGSGSELRATWSMSSPSPISPKAA